MDLHVAYRDCSININELRGGQRHDKWISLCHVKIGRLHLAITLLEGEEGMKFCGSLLNL